MPVSLTLASITEGENLWQSKGTNVLSKPKVNTAVLMDTFGIYPIII